MKQVKISKNNREYIEPCKLGNNTETETFCLLQTGPSLKIGRKYHKNKTPKDKEAIKALALRSVDKELKQLDSLENKNYFQLLECCFPKSQLTLDASELSNLVSYLQENYEPFKDGAKRYIPVGEDFDESSANNLTSIFQTKEKQKLIKFILDNDLIKDDILRSIEIKNKKIAVEEFKNRLTDQSLLEDRGPNNWQKWFKENSWVLGGDIVRILDEREIDSGNIGDYLTKSPDGYLDIIEIKRPQIGKMDFWAANKDHDNWIPSTEIVKAITQSVKYIHEVEKESDSIKFQDRVGCSVVKPRCTLIFGRSDDWDQEKYESFRILNSSYHNLTIMTYDQVLERAERILTKITEKQK